jgi:hypothetical protein
MGFLKKFKDQKQVCIRSGVDRKPGTAAVMAWVFLAPGAAPGGAAVAAVTLRHTAPPLGGPCGRRHR